MFYIALLTSTVLEDLEDIGCHKYVVMGGDCWYTDNPPDSCSWAESSSVFVR